LNPILFDISDI